MFGGSLWIGSIGSVDHTVEERSPPARLEPLEFPHYRLPLNRHDLNSELSNRLRQKICSLRTPHEIEDHDLACFNISANHEVPLDHILQLDQIPLPPQGTTQDLQSLLSELSTSNDDAYREVLRLPPTAGRQKPKLAISRNFFGSLESMARYWDASQDHYYEISKHDQSTVTDAEKDEHASASTEVYKGYRYGNGHQTPPGTRVALVRHLCKMVTHTLHCRDHEPMPAPREKLVIRGVRLASVQYPFCIARIPEDPKLARSRVVEGPLLSTYIREGTQFNSGQTAQAETTTSGGGTQSQTGPGHNSGKFDFFREVGCMLILANQRNRNIASRGVEENRADWWTFKPRFGNGSTRWGQLAYEVYEDEDPSWSPAEQVLQERKRASTTTARQSAALDQELSKMSDFTVDDLMAKNAPDIKSIPGEPLSAPRKKKLRSLDRPVGNPDDMHDGRRLMYTPQFKKKWFQDWQAVKPGPSFWDDRIRYEKIGKPSCSEHDSVYLVSCVNHHVALVHMRVHPDYLAWLDKGIGVTSRETDGGYRNDILYVQRSTWFDLFNVEQRKEFVTALWRVICWLNRERMKDM